MTDQNSSDNNTKPKRENRLKDTSDFPGFVGFLDTVLKRFRNFAFILALSPLLLLSMIAIGGAAIPGIYLFMKVYNATQNQPDFMRAIFCGLTIGVAFYLFVFSIIFIVPILNLPIRPFVKPVRSIQFDIRVVPWYYHNALHYIVRYTILELITPTPLNILYFKMMGMKIGKGVVINSSMISDICLLQFDDYVTIGGSATIIAHYGMQGFLVVDRVHIKRNTTIGLRASVFGGVTVGENNVVAPHTVLLPKTQVPDRVRGSSNT